MSRLNQLQGLARGGSTNGQSPEGIRRWLVQNGCQVPRTDRASPQANTTQATTQGNSTRSATGRTLCVRLCDGYYFPIASQSSRDRIKTDAAVCQSMHAAEGQAELFVERRLGDVGAAASADGKRYGDLDHAFRFREAYIPACHAQLKQGIAALQSRYRDAVESLPSPDPDATVKRLTAYPLPRLRPTDVGEDPETIASRFGSLALADMKRGAAAQHSPVRRVGDEYYAQIYDPDAPPAEGPQHRPPLGFDLLGAAMTTDVSGLSERNVSGSVAY